MANDIKKSILAGKLVTVDIEQEPLKKDFDTCQGSYETFPTTSNIGIFGSWRRIAVVLCILVTEMCERLTYYSILAGLILFCTSNLDIDQFNASNINQIFSGFVYLIPVFGGYLADAHIGRYNTIVGFSSIYIIGCVLLPASAIDYEDWGWGELSKTGQMCLFFAGLIFVALGTGGIKSNVSPFGAEQVEKLGPEAVQTFFNWFYWVINVGALVAYTVVAYIQQEISFAWGFFIPMASMIVALAIFVSVSGSYIRTRPKGSVFTTAYGICKEGLVKKSSTINLKPPPENEKRMFYRAKKTYGGSFDDHLVDGLVSVIKVLPFCALVIMYWAIYAQMTNTFFAQSERMDVRMDGWNIPAAALNAFNTIGIIILIPIADRIVYPCFTKMGLPLTYLKKVGIGMVLAAMSVFVAGIVEIYRKDEMNKPGGSHIQVLAGENFTASSMSVFVQIPQFTLVGASEIFTSVTTLEFAYNQAPVSMQGMLTGFFLAASGLGNWVSSAILSIVERATRDDPWWNKEINDAKMENLMFLLGGLILLNFLVFCVVAHRYKYKDPKTFVAQVGIVKEYPNGEDELGRMGISNRTFSSGEDSGTHSGDKGVAKAAVPDDQKTISNGANAGREPQTIDTGKGDSDVKAANNDSGDTGL